MPVYYKAVDGDPITGSKGGYVIAPSHRGRTIDDRAGALIGDEAYCATCGTVGVITHGVQLRGGRPTHDDVDCAIGGDLVICKCPVWPKIVPIYGRGWKIIDGPTSPTSATSALAPSLCLECLIDAAQNGASSLVRS